MSAQTPELPSDLSNAQLVGRNGARQISVAFLQPVMTRQQALVHAAWLVAVADDNDEFPAILAAVRSGS